RRLPGSEDNLANTPHRLRVRGYHGDGAQIVQDILGCDRLGSNTRLSKGDIFWNRLGQMMANHYHGHMLVKSVGCVRPSGIRGRRKHTRLRDNTDDIRRMATSSTL